jgi:hypothetical protein
MNLAECQERLASIGILFEQGLTDDELATIESEYGFRFPADLRQFLAYVLPVSNGWLDWRNSSKEEIMQRMSWPLDGMCFDIENNEFWLESWGEKPADLPAAFEIAREQVAKAPTLIPIFSHRYMPDSPSEAGNPVFSVHQTDIIYYGHNLENYLHNEFREAFGITSRTFVVSSNDLREIEFWSGLLDCA